MDLAVTDSTDGYSIVTDSGSEIVHSGPAGFLSVVADRGLRIAGTVSSLAAGAVPILSAGTVFEVLANADLAANGAASTLNLTAGTEFSMAPGGVIRAGVAVSYSGGVPSYTVTGGNSDIRINAANETLLGGLVVSSGNLVVDGGENTRSHADEFACAVQVLARPLYGHTRQLFDSSHGNHRSTWSSEGTGAVRGG
ncbi:MAG UNVERIFIED_CONTAM: hypothetical protein LVR18_42865 [Planctomycetaceae bacterium]